MNENHRKVMAKDFRLIIGLIGVCSLIGLFQSIVPILDLFNHFRIQAVVGALFCITCSYFYRDKSAVLFACVVLVLNIGIIGFKLYKTSGISGMLENTKAEFSIISSNVLTSNDDYEAVIEMVQTQNPDLVIFSEVDQKWIEQLAALEKTYPHKLLFPRPDNFGLAAFSRKPFKGEIMRAGEAQLPIMALDFGGLIVIGAHPVPPSSIRNMSENRSYLKDVVKIGSEVNGPVVIAGDLNSTLWSATLNPVIDAGFKRINPLGLAYTWPVGNWLYLLQIDHFFAKNIKAADFEVLRSVGSDHYPIRADIAY